MGFDALVVKRIYKLAVVIYRCEQVTKGYSSLDSTELDLLLASAILILSQQVFLRMIGKDV